MLRDEGTSAAVAVGLVLLDRPDSYIAVAAGDDSVDGFAFALVFGESFFAFSECWAAAAENAGDAVAAFDALLVFSVSASFPYGGRVARNSWAVFSPLAGSLPFGEEAMVFHAWFSRLFYAWSPHHIPTHWARWSGVMSLRVLGIRHLPM